MIEIFQWIYMPEAWLALFTLTILEIVLGIDNIVFISIVVNKLPKHQQEKARYIGLGLAMFIRLGLLLAISWVMGLTETVFSAFEQDISGRDLILILGGIFLVYKSAHEIYETVEVKHEVLSNKATTTFFMALVQICMLDIIFSLDSVITAVGMVDEVSIMMIAVVISIGVMIVAAKPIGNFVVNHPAIKMLALSFLTLIGFVLICEGFDYHLPKGAIYFAMALSLSILLLKMRRDKNMKKSGLCHTCNKPLDI
jgi:predicted tellurium resistance membrane protein TerC